MKYYNDKAPTFLLKLSEAKHSSEVKHDQDFSPPFGMDPVINLGEVNNLKITHFDEHSGEELASFRDVDGNLIGFRDRDFSEFTQFRKPFQLFL